MVRWPSPLLAADDADHAGAADAGHHLVAAEALQLVGDHAGGAVHVEQQLRMGVDVLPPGGDFGVQKSAMRLTIGMALLLGARRTARRGAQYGARKRLPARMG